jgi:hypothetical protein
MLSTFLALSFSYAAEGRDYAEEMHAWLWLTQRSGVKAEAEWRDGHVYRAYCQGLDDDDLEHVARLHWADKVLISGDKLNAQSPNLLIGMKRLRFLPLWGDQFKPLFTGTSPPTFTVNRPDVKLRLYWSRDDTAMVGEKGQSSAEDFMEEQRREDLAKPVPSKASFQ